MAHPLDFIWSCVSLLGSPLGECGFILKELNENVKFICDCSFSNIIRRSTEARYVGATKNGTFKLVEGNVESATQWEY